MPWSPTLDPWGEVCEGNNLDDCREDLHPGLEMAYITSSHTRPLLTAEEAGKCSSVEHPGGKGTHGLVSPGTVLSTPHYLLPGLLVFMLAPSRLTTKQWGKSFPRPESDHIVCLLQTLQ